MGLLLLSGARSVAAEEPGGEANPLSDVVNGLSAGEWGTLTVENTYNTDPADVGPTGSDSSWLYSPRLMCDLANGKMFHYGGIHAEGVSEPLHVVGQYRLATNDWASGESVQVNQDFAHGYDMADMDLAGNLYFFCYDSLVLRVRRSNGTYEALATCPAGYNITRGLAFNPSMGAAGGLVMGDGLNLLWYDIAEDEWNVILASGSLIMGEYSQTACYVAAHGGCYIGGGEGSTGIKRVLTNASQSSISAAPRAPYIGSSGDPGLDNLNVFAATTTSDLMLLCFERDEHYTFDGSDWSADQGSLDDSGLITAAGAEGIIARGMVPAHGAQDHDALVFFYLTSQSARDPATTMHVWRPA